MKQRHLLIPIIIWAIVLLLDYAAFGAMILPGGSETITCSSCPVCPDDNSPTPPPTGNFIPEEGVIYPFPIGGLEEKSFYLVTDTHTTSLKVRVNAAGNYYTIDPDLIVSNVRQPRCSDMILPYNMGTNGFWYAPGIGNTSESLLLRPPGGIPAGTTIYATVCNRMKTAGKIQIYWEKY